MKQNDSDLLERLGWTPEEAREFLRRWQQLNQDAQQDGPAGDAARRARDEALKSLGLRPHGTELRGGGLGESHVGKHDSTRYEAPGSWSDWLKAYSRGVAGGQP